MTYIVLETQTNNGVTSVVPPFTFTDRNAAENKYHSILAYAALSNVEEHAASILTGDGRLVRNECYRHDPVPTSEPEPEQEENGEPVQEGGN